MNVTVIPRNDPPFLISPAKIFIQEDTSAIIDTPFPFVVRDIDIDDPADPAHIFRLTVGSPADLLSLWWASLFSGAQIASGRFSAPPT